MMFPRRTFLKITCPPYHAVMFALLAGLLTVQPAAPHDMPKPSVPTPSVRPNIPRPDISGAVSTGTRGGTDAASRGTKSPSGSKGAKAGKDSTASGASGLPAEIAAQQALVDRLYFDYNNFRNDSSIYYEALLRATHDVDKAKSNLYDARKLHQEMRERYLSDPTAENEALVKKAEQAVYVAEKRVEVVEAKYDEAQKTFYRVRDEMRGDRARLWDQYQKESNKLENLKAKYAELPPTTNDVVDVLLGP
jgi:hypothetical protein